MSAPGRYLMYPAPRRAIGEYQTTWYSPLARMSRRPNTSSPAANVRQAKGDLFRPRGERREFVRRVAPRRVWPSRGCARRRSRINGGGAAREARTFPSPPRRLTTRPHPPCPLPPFARRLPPSLAARARARRGGISAAAAAAAAEMPVSYTHLTLPTIYSV